MKAPLVPLALALLALTVAPVGAYGTLEPANEPGTTLRERAADPAYAAADDAAGAPLSRRIDHRDGNATWQVYDDRNGNGEYDGHDEAYRVGGAYAPNATFRQARVDGNATDHVEITTYAEGGLRLRVCTADAQSGLVDGRARGLRCNGDMDRDGTSDVDEVSSQRNPWRPADDSGGDRLPLIP